MIRRLTSRRAALLGDAFAAVIVASIGVALAGLTWRLLGDPGQRLAAMPVAATPQRPVDLAPLIAAAPFGNGGGGAPVATAAADQTLLLRGLLMAVPADASTIIVSAGGGPAQTFAIGATLPNGAVLESVALDHAVLRTANGRQFLAFPNAATTGSTPASPPTNTPMASSAASPAATPPPATGLLAGLGAVPSGSGYRVAAGSSPQLRAAGLEPGDLIERVNGRPAAELAADPAAAQSALAQGNVRVDVLRGSQRLTLTIPLR